jgi:hypothetical protein
MSQQPSDKEKLIQEISNAVDASSNAPARDTARAKLDVLLASDFTASVARLSTGMEQATRVVGESLAEVASELVRTRKQMADSSVAVSRHQRALVVWTAVLSLATIAYAVGTFLPLFWRPVAVSASRERAWVLWVIGENPGTVSYPDWTPLKAFATRNACEDLVKAGFGRYDSRCLPDTVDPRGPKTK